MKTAFIIFAVLSFGGIFASLARGKVRWICLADFWTLRFYAFALGQQVDMWLRLYLRLRPNFARRNFTYFQDVRQNSVWLK